MKDKYKPGLLFGSAMTVFFIIQNLLMKDHSDTAAITKSVIIGLISGVIAGAIFGFLINKFSKSKYIDNTTRIDIAPGETIVFETLANHFKGLEAVGGKLYLTDQRLVFKSHKINIQSHEWAIRLDAIKNVTRHKSIGIIDNKIHVHTADGKVDKFVVKQPHEWFNYLQKYIV